MTPRERLLAAFAREQVDRPPVMPFLLRWIRGRYGSTGELQQLKTCEDFGFDPMILSALYLDTPLANDYVYRPDGENAYRDLPEVNVEVRTENYRDRTVHVRRFETPAGVLSDRIVWARAGMGYGDGPNPHREEPLVKSMGDIESLRFLYPQPKKGVLAHLRRVAEFVGDRAVVEFMDTTNGGGWGLECLGPEKMLLCAVEDRDLLKAVLQVSQEQHLRNLKAALDAGHRQIAVSWFQCSASVGWSPADVEEFFLPLIRESVALVQGYGGTYRYQDDGKMFGAIPRLVEMGVDVIGGLQPPPIGDCDFAEVKRRWGGDVCLMGGIDPVHTMERGTPEGVRAAVRQLLGSSGDRRGVIVGTAEAFGPDTPEENLHALAGAVRDM